VWFVTAWVHWTETVASYTYNYGKTLFQHKQAIMLFWGRKKDSPLRIVHSTSNEDLAIIGENLDTFNLATVGYDDTTRLGFLLRTDSQEIVGGIACWVYWGWLQIGALWIRSEYRGHGYGTKLLRAAEEAGKAMGCRYVHLDTFSFQAPDFYLKSGFEVVGELKDFPEGYSRYFLKKAL
jgi:ribosomal protein S18 acetylase RimI-like enzyme